MTNVRFLSLFSVLALSFGSFGEANAQTLGNPDASFDLGVVPSAMTAPDLVAVAGLDVLPEAEAQAEDEDEADEAEDEEARRATRRQVIKIVQEKTFIKYRRFELTPLIGMVNDDPFIRRILFGLNLAYHVNDAFAVELSFVGSPNFGDFDRKNLFSLLLENSEVVPDLSRLILVAAAGGMVSPIYGKVELGRQRVVQYDLFMLAGLGVMLTQDDEEIIASTDERYITQPHFSVHYGFGFRVNFNQFMAIRFDGRWYNHIEQVSRSDLSIEVRSDFGIQLGLSFFLPTSPAIEEEE